MQEGLHVEVDTSGASRPGSAAMRSQLDGRPTTPGAMTYRSSFASTPRTHPVSERRPADDPSLSLQLSLEPTLPIPLAAAALEDIRSCYGTGPTSAGSFENASDGTAAANELSTAAVVVVALLATATDECADDTDAASNIL